MARRSAFRQMLLSMLALWYDRSPKQIADASGIPKRQVSRDLRSGDINDEAFERLLAGMQCRPAAVAIVTACIESLEALEQENGLTEEEKERIEMAVLEASRVARRLLTEGVLRARTARLEGSPQQQPADLVADCWRDLNLNPWSH